MLTLVTGPPCGGKRARYVKAGAEIVCVDPGREVCIERVRREGRPLSNIDGINHWYARREAAADSWAL